MSQKRCYTPDIHGKNILAPSMCVIFNHLFHLGHFLDMWSEGLIIPVHTKGDIHEAGKYRGITLLSTMGKLFEIRCFQSRLF